MNARPSVSIAAGVQSGTGSSVQSAFGVAQHKDINLGSHTTLAMCLEPAAQTSYDQSLTSSRSADVKWQHISTCQPQAYSVCT